MKKVSVSIIDFNGRENTLDCLDSIKIINKKGFEVSIVLVDNFPSKTLVIPQKYFPHERKDNAL